jgi:hypothetical protein
MHFNIIKTHLLFLGCIGFAIKPVHQLAKKLNLIQKNITTVLIYKY